MGQSWGSPQIVQDNIICNQEFLQDEINAQLTPEKCPHLRHVISYNFFTETVRGETLKKIKFQCQPDFTKLKSLEELSINNELDNQDYKEIFKQLIEGLYEMHKNKFMGRCISLECITYAKNTKKLIYGAFGFFHSADQLQFPPECLYKLINTYEADYWLMAKMMWQLYNKKKDYYGKSIIELGKDLLAFKLAANKIDNNKEPKELIQLVNSLLPIYCGQRMSIGELLDQPFLDFEQKKRADMKQFYNNYQFGPYFLKLMKITQKRDSQKIFVYYINLRSPICKEYRKEIFQILLTYIALQLSLHYPNEAQGDDGQKKKAQKDDGLKDDRYPKLLGTLSKYLTMSSKILKDKLVLQEKGFLENREEFLLFRDEIVKSHDLAYKFEKFVIKQWHNDFQELKDYDDEEIIKIIHFKLYQFRAKATMPKSISQKVLLNLLCNLKVDDKTMEKLNSDDLKQAFLELLERIQSQE